MVAITSPNGSKAGKSADWLPLRGRKAVIWPDADAAGLDYTNVAAKALIAAGAIGVAIVSPPSSVKVGWDAADALAEGGNRTRRRAHRRSEGGQRQAPEGCR